MAVNGYVLFTTVHMILSERDAITRKLSQPTYKSDLSSSLTALSHKNNCNY